MLLEQLPTSSSSSSSRADNGNQETSSQAHIENPSPPTPTTAPPQTSAATSLPEMDEETQRRLTRILRSFPSDVDVATVYAAVKAQMGVTLSRDKAVASTSQNHPRNPSSTTQTQVPPSASLNLHPSSPWYRTMGTTLKKKERSSPPPLRPKEYRPCRLYMQKARLFLVLRRHPMEKAPTPILYSGQRNRSRL